VSHANGQRSGGNAQCYKPSKLFIVTFLCFCTIVCQINLLGDSLADTWFCQTKVWTPFSESLYVASDIRNPMGQKNRISLNLSTNV
jgi:hypothetical protein